MQEGLGPLRFRDLRLLLYLVVSLEAATAFLACLCRSVHTAVKFSGFKGYLESDSFCSANLVA